MLGTIVTLDESVAPFHTPEMTQHSKQWLKKEPCPIKTKGYATRAKQMVLAFFDNKGLIYTNYVRGPRWTPTTSGKPWATS
jgi:hypothetical protein